MFNNQNQNQITQTEILPFISKPYQNIYNDIFYKNLLNFDGEYIIISNFQITKRSNISVRSCSNQLFKSLNEDLRIKNGISASM